ncbi:MAG: DNA repair protein RecN [Gemmatimonadetes bacterium]|nr:DNA repair protein RecN [Gemmatimonadota bacterium]
MLTELRVRDLAVIADVRIPLKPGLNVLTGETGAGKSMLVDALALLLGERASADLVRPGAERAVVEAVFEPHRDPDLAGAADELGIDLGEEGLVVRREISAEGRSRAWANGSPTTVSALSRLGAFLVDLHGQHEAQSLLRPAAQRDMLDAFGDALEERQQVRQAFETTAQLKDAEETLRRRCQEIRKRADYLQHVAREIADAAPQTGEEEALESESRRLSHVEELTRLAERLSELLDAEEHGVLAGLAGVAKTLGQLERIDPDTTKWNELLDAANAVLDELTRAVQEYASGIEVDPSRLAEVERRRDLLFRLAQKYGPSMADILRTGEEARQELETLETADGDLASLAARRVEAEGALTAAAAALTAKRVVAAGRLAKAVERLLPGLGLPGAKFLVDLKPLDSATASGSDQVAFLVQLNVGLEARPLAQVASGGELSRLMLALKVVLASHDAIPTLVFDEIDQGVGAEVGARVAEALGKVGQSRQVLVISHLAHIAARAGHHIKVVKRPKKGVATAEVEVLSKNERIEEIARLLGDPADPGLRRHAEELLSRQLVEA